MNMKTWNQMQLLVKFQIGHVHFIQGGAVWLCYLLYSYMLDNQKTDTDMWFIHHFFPLVCSVAWNEAHTV